MRGRKFRKNALARREQVALEKISERGDAIVEIRNLAVDMAIRVSGELLNEDQEQKQSQELRKQQLESSPETFNSQQIVRKRSHGMVLWHSTEDVFPTITHRTFR